MPGVCVRNNILEYNIVSKHISDTKSNPISGLVWRFYIININNTLDFCLFAKKQEEEESIPVGCVPPACQL